MLTNKKIEQAIKYSEYPNQPQALDMADVALESLDALRWRDPVKEPPRNMQNCFVVVKYGKRIWGKDMAYYTAKNCKFWGKDRQELENVIAWMPLR